LIYYGNRVKQTVYKGSYTIYYIVYGDSMGENISVRLDEKSMEELEEVVEEWHSDRSEAIRRLLSRALHEWKVEKALGDLRKHHISIGKAAEECDVPVWEMVELAKEKNIDWTGYGQKDLEKDLKLLERRRA
jgi:predicted HTH domain antitoxin